MFVSFLQVFVIIRHWIASRQTTTIQVRRAPVVELTIPVWICSHCSLIDEDDFCYFS